MSSVRFNCCCCYSPGELKTLCSPALDIYMLIYNTQDLENVDIPILTCLGCFEFLKEVHRFRIECRPFDEIFHHNLDVKPFNNESTSRNPIDENSSQIGQSIEQTDIQINKMEVDSDSETFQRASEAFSEGLSASNEVNDSWLYGSVDSNQGCDKTNQTAVMAVDSEQKRIGEKSVEHLVSNGSKLEGNNSLLTYCDKRYKCTECAFKTAYSQVLKDHTAHKHSDEKPFICDQCDYCGKTKNNLLAHKRIHSDDTVNCFKCPECPFKTKTSLRLKYHTARRHSDDKPFSCDQCNYSGKLKRDLLEHIKRNHVERTEVNYFKCTECSFKTAALIRLKFHIARRHTDDKPYSCDQCDYRGKMMSDLKLHKTIHLDDTEKNRFKCNECPFKTRTGEQLKKHVLRRHSDHKPFSCDQCDYRSKMKCDLLVHQRIHLDETENPFKCTQCSFKTTTSLQLKQHTARRHTDEKPFSCDRCDYRTKIKHDLQVHKTIHLDDSEKNLFECTECPFKTAVLIRLKFHIARRHSDDKPFGCEQCNYRGKMLSDLKLHKLTHLDDAEKNRFKCGECSYGTITKYRLQRHIKTVHNSEKSLKTKKIRKNKRSEKES